jgi:peptide/nickel transport system substrate-binding protein
MPMLSRTSLKALSVSVLALVLGMGAGADAADLRLNIPADPGQIDPITLSELVAGDVLSNIYEGFTTLDENGNVVPALALSWEDMAGTLTWRFHLRPGVKFHSGRPFTAKDVKYTYEQLLIPANKGGLNASFLDNVVGADAMKDGSAIELAGVKIVDDMTVDVTFTKHDVLFPIYPIVFMDSGIVAEKGPTWYETASAGTGPFRFEAWKLGQEVVLKANPDYWRGAPKIDGVRFLVVPDGDTAISMYEAGELDLVYAADTVLRRVLADGQFKDQMLTAPAAQTQYIGMTKALYAPFEDKRVREAVCLSFDRDAIVTGIYEGAALPLPGLVPPHSPGFSADVKGASYDPERAKALMAEAGYPDDRAQPQLQPLPRVAVPDRSGDAGRGRDRRAQSLHRGQQRRRSAVLPLGLGRGLP